MSDLYPVSAIDRSMYVYWQANMVLWPALATQVVGSGVSEVAIDEVDIGLSRLRGQEVFCH